MRGLRLCLSMTIVHDEPRGRFRMATDHGEAIVDYDRSGETLDFTHTFVPPADRNRGIAEALVRHALDGAEDRKFKVQASCWYVARYIQARRPALRPHPPPR